MGNRHVPRCLAPLLPAMASSLPASDLDRFAKPSRGGETRTFSCLGEPVPLLPAAPIKRGRTILPFLERWRMATPQFSAEPRMPQAPAILRSPRCP